jgi:hypothetical protein
MDRTPPVVIMAFAAFTFFGAFRYMMQPRILKRDFPVGWIAESPIWVLRAIGVVIAALGFLLLYKAFTLISAGTY